MVEAKDFLHTKSTALLRFFRIPQLFLCTQMLHLIHRMELLPVPIPQTEHGDFEVSIDLVFSPVLEGFVFFMFPFKTFSIKHNIVSTSSYLQEA